MRRERKRNGARKRSSSTRMEGSKINISLYVQQKEEEDGEDKKQKEQEEDDSYQF